MVFIFSEIGWGSVKNIEKNTWNMKLYLLYFSFTNGQTFYVHIFPSGSDFIRYLPKKPQGNGLAIRHLIQPVVEDAAVWRCSKFSQTLTCLDSRSCLFLSLVKPLWPNISTQKPIKQSKKNSALSFETNIPYNREWINQRFSILY